MQILKMDCKIWETIILAWVNSMKSGTPINRIYQVNDSILTDIVKKFKCDTQNLVEFLKTTFPNLSVSDTLTSTYDYMNAATCLLIYVSFSKRIELEELREKMCLMLDNEMQLKIAEFLTTIGNHRDVFQLSLKTITKEIMDFIEMQESKNTVLTTPVKHNVSAGSIDSPLQGFFQTPKRGREMSTNKSLNVMHGDGDHIRQIKRLSDQLAEEESEKTALQEQLTASIQKCNEIEMKLKDKVEEVKQLKYEWDAESKKNDDEIVTLKDRVQRKIDEEKKLKCDLTHLESVVSSLEADINKSFAEKVKLEHQLKLSMEKCSSFELQVKQLNEYNLQLEEAVAVKEKELLEVKENFEKTYKTDLQVNFNDTSLDGSICVPETMDVVVEKLLKEKTEENEMLKEVIQELQEQKKKKLNELENKNRELEEKYLAISELKYLNNELMAKVVRFESTEKDLVSVREELQKANDDVNRLIEENSSLNEKCNALNSKTSEQEKSLVDLKNSKRLVQFDLLKLAEDFRSVQQRLEAEVSNITKLQSAKNGLQDADGDYVLNDIREKLESDSFNVSKTLGKDLQVIPVNFLTNSKYERIDELLHACEGYDLNWSDSRTLMQKTCLQLNDSIITLKLKIHDFEVNQKTTIEEKAKLEKCLKTAEQKIAEIQCLHSSEVKKLRVEIEEKMVKITELEDLINRLRTHAANLMPAKDPAKNASTLKRECSSTHVFEGGDCNQITSGHTGDSGTKAAAKYLLQMKEELNDSLEEVPVCNKTFDIVNLDNDKNLVNKTFSISKSVDPIANSVSKVCSWSISPPSKSQSKNVGKREKKSPRGEGWVIPLVHAKAKAKRKASYSGHDLTGFDSSSNVTKSSSLSSVLDLNAVLQQKVDSSGTTSFFSVKDLNDRYGRSSDLRKAYSSEICLNNLKNADNSVHQVFRLTERHDDPLADIFKSDMLEYDRNKKLEWEKKFSRMRKEIIELSNECERLRSSLLESERKRKKERESLEKYQSTMAQNITIKYENQLEELKSEMKDLYNRELAKNKNDQSKLNADIREQNKRFKEHIDQLRNKLWDLGEKLLQEQKSKRDIERIYSELKKKFDSMILSKDKELNVFDCAELLQCKDFSNDEKNRLSVIRQSAFPTIPMEDEDEVFDNRFLEDMKTGLYPSESPEDRLLELQNRNTLCLPHLKSSYPAETQFHNPTLFKENELKQGLLQFGQESQSLTDSDHSMTRSLLPEYKGKKKDQTSYKKPGPPTPSKHGGRHSIQSCDFRITPRNVLRELNDQQHDRNSKGTPSRLKSLLPMANSKRESLGGRSENTAPVTPRTKLGKIFRKPFGARDH